MRYIYTPQIQVLMGRAFLISRRVLGPRGQRRRAGGRKQKQKTQEEGEEEGDGEEDCEEDGEEFEFCDGNSAYASDGLADEPE